MERSSIEDKWKRLAEQTRAEAEKLPAGRAKDAMLKKALQLDTACEMESWISSPGLKPPTDLIRLKSSRRSTSER